MLWIPRCSGLAYKSRAPDRVLYTARRPEGFRMARVKCRSVIMDYAGEGENTYEFDAEDNIFDLPADEVVEALMRHIDQRKILREPVRYELNSANRYPEKRLVCAMGSFLLKDGARLPFITMIGPA